ncbi:hypothetical protein VTN00DRAFT_1318 [Thermoascus crustaceus]|uniref:uncharacterized protein n=1 Tax=Thermoascus crustaceus TaxID=5088 RepID=UPI0037421355
MLLKKTHHPPLSSWNPTPDSSPQPSPTSSEGDADDDANMDSSAGCRPLSVAIPTGPFYCAARPTLDDVLANTSHPPYTLSAFMAYLSQNHCLETLEFTMEAHRYGETYHAVSRQLGESPIYTDCPQSQHLCMLWQRLLSAYIVPGSPREINLSSEVRDGLLQHAQSTIPPPPETLHSAVKRIRDLMEESIFIPFLNSLSPTAHSMPQPGSPYETPDDPMRLSNSSLDESTVKRVLSKGRRLSPQSSMLEFGSLRSQAGGHSGRTNPALSMVAALGKTGTRPSGHSSTGSGDSGSTVLTNDSSTPSPVSSELMTPPTTPPFGDLNPYTGPSPRSRADKPWKKMGLKLGWKKRSGGGSAHRPETGE